MLLMKIKKTSYNELKKHNDIPGSGILNIVNRSSKAKTHGSLSGTKIKIFLK
jgi:hypothetical protein